MFRRALRAAEAQYQSRSSGNTSDVSVDGTSRRDVNVLVYVRRRLAMCARRLGRLKEAAKMMRDLIKEFPMLNVMNIHENLIECLLEMQVTWNICTQRHKSLHSTGVRRRTGSTGALR